MINHIYIDPSPDKAIMVSEFTQDLFLFVSTCSTDSCSNKHLIRLLPFLYPAVPALGSHYSSFRSVFDRVYKVGEFTRQVKIQQKAVN